MVVFQVFQNVGMTMGIMPITGIPLPLVSYGGSATVAFLVMIGLVRVRPHAQVYLTADRGLASDRSGAVRRSGARSTDCRAKRGGAARSAAETGA